MRTHKLPKSFGDEPTGADLAEIDQEWPLIAAEMDLLDAQIHVILGPATPTDLDRQRVRRARRRVLREARALHAAQAAANERRNALPVAS